MINEQPSLNDEFDFWEWSADDFITARPFKRYIEKLKTCLLGRPIQSIHTMGHIFNNYDNEEMDEWDAKGSIELDEPIVLMCGNEQLEILFYNTSHAKVGLNTLTMAEKSYQRVKWQDVSRLFPKVIGQSIVEIKLLTFTKGFYDSVFMGDGNRIDGGDYFDELLLILSDGSILEIFGQCEYMWVIERLQDEVKLFPTHSRVFVGDVREAPKGSYIYFLPHKKGCATEQDILSYCDECDSITHECDCGSGQNILSLYEDDWDMLHWAIRCVFPDYDMHESDWRVAPADWERIMREWQFIFIADSFDQVYEHFCGIDYNKRTIGNTSLQYYLNHTGHLWKYRDSAWEIYMDFIEWYKSVKDDNAYISISGI